MFSQHVQDKAMMLEYTGDKNGNRIPDPEEIGRKPLNGDGDFRSQECIALLKQADIIVTNPPFSLFRPYVSQLIQYKKNFLILGNINAVKYKEIFPLIKENKVWLGHAGNKSIEFGLPDHYPLTGKQTRIDDEGNKYVTVPGISWFTNLEIKKRYDWLILDKSYTPEQYPKYENYDAIDVCPTKNIPKDYPGVMGVPISFLTKYNPDQFEILGIGIAGLGLQAGIQPYKPEHKKYRREVQKRGAVDGDLYMMVDGVVTVPYSRILIRNKKV